MTFQPPTNAQKTPSNHPANTPTDPRTNAIPTPTNALATHSPIPPRSLRALGCAGAPPAGASATSVGRVHSHPARVGEFAADQEAKSPPAASRLGARYR